MIRIFGTLILLLAIGNLAVFAHQDALVMTTKEVLFGATSTDKMFEETINQLKLKYE